jgi:hypothetical protein
MDRSVKLKEIRVPLEDLYLDPNNPRFARSLNLSKELRDDEIPGVQAQLRKMFINERDTESGADEGDVEAEGPIRIGDLVRSMEEIGFVPIDRVVVRKLAKGGYVVIEGNRRVSAAKYIVDLRPTGNPEARQRHEEIVQTLRKLDVLELITDGLTPQEVHDQIGVILGLRHFGSVLEWGLLAKAVNIYNEYRNTPPAQTEFKFDPARVSKVGIRLSESRPNVKNALRTYVAFQQLQAAFPHAQPKPSHYSLLQACVTNRKLNTAKFVEQDPNSFQLSAASLEILNIVCEFENRDQLPEDQKILAKPQSVSRLATLVEHATSDEDTAVRAFASSLRDAVLIKDRTLDDAIDNLRSFISDRVWTESLEALMEKVEEPGASSSGPDADQNRRLRLKDFEPTGNDVLKLDDARKAFKNVRLILRV